VSEREVAHRKSSRTRGRTARPPVPGCYSHQPPHSRIRTPASGTNLGRCRGLAGSER
jgi:hypothetical protein